MNYLRATLVRLGQPAGNGPGNHGDDPISVNFWEPRWRKSRDAVQERIRRCGDAHLQAELDMLDGQWAEVVSTERQRQSVITAPPNFVDRPVPDDAETDELPVVDRTSGSYSKRNLETWYIQWVSQNIASKVIPSRDDDWKAAKAALGDGVPRDIVRGLRNRRAPASWRQHGRRTSAAETGGETGDETGEETGEER
jgi:hypothetical protein